jgi:hypothetical protein
MEITFEEEKKAFDKVREKAEGILAKKLANCIESGKHDTSVGKLEYRTGTSGIVSRRIGIYVFGKCSNCNSLYERDPTEEEMKTSEYKEMIQYLSPPLSQIEKLQIPLM